MQKEKNKLLNKNKDIDVPPSDFSQAILRFVIVTGLLAWSILRTEQRSLDFLLNQGFVVLTIVYWFISIGFLVWTKFLNRSSDVQSLKYRVTRTSAVLADIIAISAYTAIAGPHGLILYPIYLQTIIGHGYRFGLSYFYLSISAGLIGFTMAISYNRAFADNSLVVAYYLGLLLVPLYTLLLLRRHAKVQEKLKHVNESRSRFIANMSHELRTPLHAILSLNEVLREEFSLPERRDDGVMEKLRMVNESAEHLLSLVNRVLDIASSDQDHDKKIPIAPMNVRETLFKAESISAGTAYTKGLTIETYISPLVPNIVESSSGLLEEILVNIVGNSVKYTDRGRVSIHVSASDTSPASMCELHIRVIDTGIGIKEDVLPYIFEPFAMGDDDSARRHNGTGLGLTITKQYIETLGGSVNISSEVGTGTAVDIRLPVTVCPTTDSSSLTEISALIITANAISPPERLLFEHHNIDVVTMPLEQAVRLNFEKENLDLIFVGSEYNKDLDELDYLNSLVRSPIISYGAEILAVPEIGANAFNYCSTVRPAVSNDILASKFLIRSSTTTMDLSISPAQGKFKVLVADDNEINLRTARLALEPAGHSVDVVNNGESALEALDSNRYDLVLMDMHMPVMDGIEAATLYSYESTDPVPIVLITADVTDEALSAARETQVAAVLNKPIRPKELRAAVQKYARPNPDNDRLSENDIAVNVVENQMRTSSLFDPKEIQELVDCGANRKELLEMIDIFESDATASVNLAIDAAKQNRYSVIYSEMHSLRGAASTLGVTALGDKAYALESAQYAKNGVQVEQLEELLPLIADAAVWLKQAIGGEITA